MPAGIFLKPKDIQVLNEVTYDVARKIYNNVRDGLGKPKGKKITPEEYAQFEMIDVTIVKQALNIK